MGRRQNQTPEPNWQRQKSAVDEFHRSSRQNACSACRKVPPSARTLANASTDFPSCFAPTRQPRARIPSLFVGAEEDELKQLLDVPEAYAFAAMIPLGRPVKQLTKLSRQPVYEFAVRERFDGDAFGDTTG